MTGLIGVFFLVVVFFLIIWVLVWVIRKNILLTQPCQGWVVEKFMMPSLGFISPSMIGSSLMYLNLPQEGEWWLLKVTDCDGHQKEFVVNGFTGRRLKVGEYFNPDELSQLSA